MRTFKSIEKEREGSNKLRWFFAILFILIGAFLWSLTIDQMGTLAHIFMKLIGAGSMIVVFFILKGKKNK